MILRADALHIPLADETVQCVVTSPPYWGLRKYAGVPDLVWGGDADCAHAWGEYSRPGMTGGTAKVTLNGGPEWQNQTMFQGHTAAFCHRCNAWRGQLGLEPTIAAYIEHMVAVFREVRRVLRADGVCFLNIGDSYSGSMKGYSPNGPGYGGPKQRTNTGSMGLPPSPPTDGLKPKDLCLIPERLAIALQDDGWWIRSRIAWVKDNCMPESVEDRCTSAWEHIWQLAKSERYFFDAEAIRERSVTGDPRRPYTSNGAWALDGRPEHQRHGGQVRNSDASSRNCRNWWRINSAAFPDAHYATFPPKLVERCILAGTPERGSCSACGAPWVRVVARKEYGDWRSTSRKQDLEHGNKKNQDAWSRGEYEAPKTLGWRPQCRCDAPTRPALVFDCFGGSGTVLQTAATLGRRAVMTELSWEYCQMAKRRSAQIGLFAQPASARDSSAPPK